MFSLTPSFHVLPARQPCLIMAYFLVYCCLYKSVLLLLRVQGHVTNNCAHLARSAGSCVVYVFYKLHCIQMCLFKCKQQWRRDTTLLFKFIQYDHRLVLLLVYNTTYIMTLGIKTHLYLAWITNSSIFLIYLMSMWVAISVRGV